MRGHVTWWGWGGLGISVTKASVIKVLISRHRWRRAGGVVARLGCVCVRVSE